jgi:eukaryotic-like serine/threonine-protein kinase
VSEPLKSGDVIATRYRLERPLGAGGMGAVWEATHLLTHKRLALKVVHEGNADPAARRRVLREARAACAVKHPNVVTVHDVLERDDGTPVLVMDLLEGESLAARLERERTLPPKDAITITRAILSALAAAHTAGIVHRDLKPDNVFLVASGEVKILDFGIAKLAGRDPATQETNRLTETGAMVGTPHYMAPEQAFGEADIDARADLWAVGAVLYECLCGVPPTDGQNLGQILKALATGRIEPLSNRAKTVPRELATIVDGLLRVERSERPSSAEAVIASLDALGDLSSALPSPPIPSAIAARERTPQPATRSITSEPRRRTWIFAVAAALFVLVAFGGSAALLVRGRPKKPPAPAPVVATSDPTPSMPAVPSSVVTTIDPPPSNTVSAPSTSPSARPQLKAIHARPAPTARASAASSTGPASPLLDKPTF